MQCIETRNLTRVPLSSLRGHQGGLFCRRVRYKKGHDDGISEDPGKIDDFDSFETIKTNCRSEITSGCNGSKSIRTLFL